MRLKSLKGDILIGGLLLTSAVLYGIDYLAFGRAGEIGFGFLGNLAFLPLYVALVTLVIERILKKREQESIRQKLNMVIGVFFSEVGTHLVKAGIDFVRNGEELCQRMRISPQWQHADFDALHTYLAAADLQVECARGDLPGIRTFLVGKRDFLLTLMENPNLLEHDEFTDLLWAVFHLLEELEARPTLQGLSLADQEHLAGDLRRVYSHLLSGWVAYLQHLRDDYPYLFSLAVRKNPLNPAARVEIG
jgi:hypothetical protein